MTIRKPARKRKTPVPQQQSAGSLPPWQFWERLMVISRSVPREQWEAVPSDAAARLDEYLDQGTGFHNR